jgi:hypothetical protein
MLEIQEKRRLILKGICANILQIVPKIKRRFNLSHQHTIKIVDRKE